MVAIWHLRKMVFDQEGSSARWSRNQTHDSMDLSNCLVRCSIHETIFNFSFAWIKVSRKKWVDNLVDISVMS